LRTNNLAEANKLAVAKFTMPKPKHLYRDIFKKAFLLTIKNPFLWVFGLFTTFLGIGSFYELILKRSLDQIFTFGRLELQVNTLKIFGTTFAGSIGDLKLVELLGFIGYIALALSVLVISVWVAISAFGAIIHATQKIDKKKKTGFWDAFKAGLKHFWKLFIVNIFGKTIIFTLLLVTGWLLSHLLINNSLFNAIVYFLSFLIFVSISLFISFLVVYTSAYIVIKNHTTKKSIKQSWQLFKNSWVVTIEASIILFFVNLLTKFLIVIFIKLGCWRNTISTP